METINQRRTSAAVTGAPKPAGAVSSIFDAGRAAKPERRRMAPLDVDSLVIQSGVPLPVTGRGTPGTSPYQALLAKMKSGDCVELSVGYAKSLASAAKKAGVKLALRRLTDDTMGVWRL